MYASTSRNRERDRASHSSGSLFSFPLALPGDRRRGVQLEFCEKRDTSGTRSPEYTDIRSGPEERDMDPKLQCSHVKPTLWVQFRETPKMNWCRRHRSVQNAPATARVMPGLARRVSGDRIRPAQWVPDK